MSFHAYLNPQIKPTRHNSRFPFLCALEGDSSATFRLLAEVSQGSSAAEFCGNSLEILDDLLKWQFYWYKA